MFPEEIQKLNMCGYYFIKICRETNAEELTHTLEGVTFEGKQLGDWEIIVRKKKKDA